jgi:hypothetical protein
MRKILSTILNTIKAYCKKLADLQQEVIKFNEEIEKQLRGDKK